MRYNQSFHGLALNNLSLSQFQHFRYPQEEKVAKDLGSVGVNVREGGLHIPIRFIRPVGEPQSLGSADEHDRVLGDGEEFGMARVRGLPHGVIKAVWGSVLRVGAEERRGIILCVMDYYD